MPFVENKHVPKSLFSSLKYSSLNWWSIFRLIIERKEKGFNTRRNSLSRPPNSVLNYSSEENSQLNWHLFFLQPLFQYFPMNKWYCWIIIKLIGPHAEKEPKTEHTRTVCIIWFTLLSLLDSAKNFGKLICGNLKGRKKILKQISYIFILGKSSLSNKKEMKAKAYIQVYIVLAMMGKFASTLSD